MEVASKVFATGVALVVVWIFVKILQHFAYLQKIRSTTTLPGPFRDASHGPFKSSPPRKMGIHSTILAVTRKYGDIYIKTFPIPLIFVSGVDVTREVLSTQNLPKSNSNSSNALETVIGRMLQSRDHFYPHGDWKVYRKLMDPPFRKSSIRELTPLFEKHALHLVHRLQKIVAGQEAAILSVSDYFTKTTMDIICDSAFGYQLNSIQDQNLHISQAFDTVLKTVISPINILFPFLRGYVRWSVRKPYGLVKQILDTAIDERLAYIRAHPNEQYTVLLDLMLTSETDGKTLNRQELLSELFLFFLAGHETSANTLSFVVNYLAVYPDVMKRVREEIERVFDGKETLSYEDQESLTYTTQVIKEVLRINPIAAFLARQVPFEGDTYIGGHLLPKGAKIFFSPYLVHHNLNVWQDPERFDPDRFGPENNSHSSFAYIPFSTGSRVCLGMQFFWCEARVILAHYLRHFDFQLPANRAADPFKVKFSGVLRLHDSTLIVKPRKI